MAGRHVVMFSGGIGSWAAAKRVVERHGSANVTLLFTDTLMEDEDLYRFIDEAATNVGAALVKIADGRTPWDVFFDEGMLGGTRAGICSRVLKREVANKWLAEKCDPADTVVYLGIDWTEAHRFDDGDGHGAKNVHARNGWRCEAPMLDAPYMTKRDMLRWLTDEGIKPPRLYGLGFAHNNCGGFCVKAGVGHFAHLLRALPERYAEHEAREAAFRSSVGWRQTILRDRVGGATKPLSMTALRERIQSGGQVDLFEIGGCGCFMDDERDAA